MWRTGVDLLTTIRAAQPRTPILVVSAHPEDGLAPRDTLSNREVQVLTLIGEGTTVTEIAERLRLSVKTISTYRTRLLQKLNLRNTAELIRYAIDHGLVH